MNRGQQEYYKRDYAQAKLEGKPFFPYAVYKDLLIATLAIAAVIGMSIWHRPEIGEPINPASTDFVPRPEWYFFFLFELLKIFEGQNVLMPVIMATFIVPNILMVLLIATPFIDRGPERRIEKRPFALFTGIAVIAFLGYMTYLGASSDEGIGAEGLPLTGLDEKGQAGADLFVANNCTACHNVAGVGAAGPGPDLTNLGTQGQTAEQWGEYIQAPPGGVMPAFTTFTPQQYDEIGTFLAGLGTKYK